MRWVLFLLNLCVDYFYRQYLFILPYYVIWIYTAVYAEHCTCITLTAPGTNLYLPNLVQLIKLPWLISSLYTAEMIKHGNLTGSRPYGCSGTKLTLQEVPGLTPIIVEARHFAQVFHTGITWIIPPCGSFKECSFIQIWLILNVCYFQMLLIFNVTVNIADGNVMMVKPVF